MRDVQEEVQEALTQTQLSFGFDGLRECSCGADPAHFFRDDWTPEFYLNPNGPNAPCALCGTLVRSTEPRYKVFSAPGHGTDRDGHGDGLWVCAGDLAGAILHQRNKYLGEENAL